MESCVENDPGTEVSISADTATEPTITPEPRQVPREPRFSILGGLVGLLAALLGSALDIVLVALTAAGVFVAVTLTDLPKTDVLKEVRLQEPLRVYSADGSLMAEFGVQRRNPVSFNEIPPLLVKAFLATEDARFFEHEGVDLKGIARAAISYIRTGERKQGGSTITMQVARNFFLSRERTFRRKLAELLLSLHIERTLTKEEILELYLNKIFFGHRAYGVSAAAALYYGKTLDQLSIPEMATLAGVPKAPSANNPVSNPTRARERRNYILRRMLELGYINDEEFHTAYEAKDHARLHRKEPDLQAGYAAEMVRREMVERFGKDAYREGYRVTTTIDPRLQRAAQDAVRKSLLDYDRRHGYHGAEARYDVAGAGDTKLDRLLDSAGALPDLTAGIVVHAGAKEAQVYIGKGARVTLRHKQVKWARPFKNENSKGPAPRKVADALTVGDLIRLKRDADGTWELSQSPSVAGALVALSPADGAIRALVGGFSFDDSKFNRAVDARRQPGSSFKPFIYAAALNKGYTPASLVRDEPISVRLNRRKMWTPQNFDHKTLGRIRMRVALTRSRNLASINLLSRVGMDDARDYIQRFGFDLKELPLGLSMALGTAEVSPLQMAGAFAVFANGGFRVMPYIISRVENGAGDLVFKANPPRACSDCWFRYEESTAATAPLEQAQSTLAERVLDPRLAYEMTSMMQDVIKHGTGRRALQLERDDLAGKTGTTNDVRDSWFCGFQKDLVTVTWMGFDEFHPLGKGETGGRAGLGMWVDFMREALKDKPQAILEPPEGMVEVRISRGSGRRSASGELVEWVPAEYADALQGPRPVAYVSRGGRSGRSGGGARRPAPRVIDELF
jgi:penicillin-binding protein 1A